MKKNALNCKLRAKLYKQLHHKQIQHLFEYLDLSPINRKQRAQLINSLLKFSGTFFPLLLLLFVCDVFSMLIFASLALYENLARVSTVLEICQKESKNESAIRTASRVKRVKKEIGRNVKIGFLAETSSTRCEFQINNKNTLYLCYF